eukprot:3482994-Rhodomonas_salina.1
MSGRIHKQQYPSNPSLDLTLATTSGSGFSDRSHTWIENFVGMGVDLGLMLVPRDVPVIRDAVVLM